MQVNHFVTLYLTSPTATVIDAVQGDGVRVIAASLMEGADPWPVPEGVKAGISYELPGKLPGYYDQLRDGTPACTIAGNLVTAAIDGSLTAAAGNVKLAIVLRDSDGGQVATFPVTLRVAKRPGRIGAEEMAPVSAYEGMLLYGGPGGEVLSLGVGDGLFVEDGELRSEGGGGNAKELVEQHNASAGAHPDIRRDVAKLATHLSALADSDDDTLDQLSEIVAYIKSNKTLIDAVTTSKVSVADIVNDLVTSVANKPLSAEQGRVLKNLYDLLDTRIGDAVNALSGKVGADELAETLEGYAKTEDIPTKPEDIGAQPEGDYALRSEIPTDAHITGLINTALGVIENGTY